MIDLERLRADTPGCARVVHFNNAGAALPPRPVLEAQLRHLQLEAEIGGYEAAERAHDSIEHTYDALARLLNASRDEIAVVENATRAWDMAFYALPFAAGDRILTGSNEYASNYIAFLQVARRTGAVIDVVPDDEHGQLDTAALERMIDGRVRLIAVTHAPTNGGLLNPAAAIGRIAQAAGVPYLLDACQSAGQVPLDVEALGCDMLAATGRKYLRGPRGVGFLYVRRGLLERLEPPFLDLRAATWVARDRYEIRPDARRFENWESNIAARIGLGVAVDYALDLGIEAIRARVQPLAEQLRHRLRAIGAEVHDRGCERSGIVSFTLPGRSPAAIKTALARQEINVTTTSIASTRLDMEARGLCEMVRASVHYYNTEDEVERLVAALSEA